jgi:methyl halide transferase
MEKEYWDNRWVNQQLGWDIGEVAKPLKEFFDTLDDKSIKILIPGAGNSYEAEYLNDLGFDNVWVVDISEHALKSFLQRCPNFPKDKAVKINFFDLEDQFDLIIEQTFFCSMHPDRRGDYAKKMKELLSENGKLLGVLFDCTFDAGPPFGGSKKEYMEIFTPIFKSVSMEPCLNSIAPRLGSELWVEMS